MSARWYQVAYAVAAGVAFAGSGVVHAANLPPVQTAGDAEYVSGGIGQDESQAMKEASKHWPLTLEFAKQVGHHADYIADVNVRVRDDAGHTALEAEANGPFMLARLAPGRYTVDASYGGKTLHERVVIRRGEPARATFVWPAGASEGVV